MSPRENLPKGLASPWYRKFFEAFGKQDLPYPISGRDEYAFLWDQWNQWHRAGSAERTASKTWHYEPMPVPPARVTPPEPEPREEPPEPEPEAVAPPAPPKRKGRFQTLEL